MDKATLLEEVQTAHDEWEGVLAEVGEARMTEPGVAGEWSVKDIIAHVTWFEREMVGVLRAHALVGSELWNLPQDEENAAIYAKNRERPLDDVLREARDVYAQLLEELRGMSDEAVNDPGQFRDMPADWIPWQVLAGNTYRHYRDHAATIREWLARGGA